MSNPMSVQQAVELAADADEVIVEAIHLLARFAREKNRPKTEQLIGIARDMLRVHKRINVYVRQQQQRQEPTPQGELKLGLARRRPSGVTMRLRDEMDELGWRRGRRTT